MSKYYIAYGSNLNVEQMSIRCPGAVPVGKAYLKNHRLAFKGSAIGTGNYLTIIKSRNHQVPVVVWKVTDSDIERLDIYEGYPRFYGIKNFNNLEVETFDGSIEELSCFAYIMNEGFDFGMPSSNYVNTCLVGYENFNMDTEYISEALKYTRKKNDSLFTGRSNSIRSKVS